MNRRGNGLMVCEAPPGIGFPLFFLPPIDDRESNETDAQQKHRAGFGDGGRLGDDKRRGNGIKFMRRRLRLVYILDPPACCYCGIPASGIG